VAQKNRDITPLYITAESFINDMIIHLRERKMAHFKMKYRENCSLLLMDDIQFLSRKEQMQEELFHTFEYLKNQGHQIVFTSDVLPREIEGLMERLRTRFESGMTVDLQPPDVETLQAIISKKSTLLGIHIPSDVSHYIATHAQGNVREVEGALNRLVGHAKLKQEQITLGLAHRELSALFQERRTISLNAESILHSVCSAYNIEKSGIQGRSRATKFSLPRQIAMYLMKEYTDLSNRQIGQCLGNRDHSTVIHGHTKISERLEIDLSLQQSLNLIKRDLEIRD
jgi:chromosomal replication initiator protein